MHFQEQKSPKSGTQHNFPEHINKHIPTLKKKIWLPDFTGKSQGNQHCAPPLPIPHSWERCLPITLDCLPVQSFHNTTVNFRVHACVTFLVIGGERPLLVVYFLKSLETSPFRWRWFCRCAINRLGHAFPNTQNVFTNGALIPIYSACNFVETLEKLLLLHVFHARAEHFWEYICIISAFCACTMCQKVTSVSSSTNASATLVKNWKGSVCCCCFSWMAESGTFERLSIFLERAVDFQEQIRKNHNGRHVYSGYTQQNKSKALPSFCIPPL